MRVILDTNALISAIGWEGAPNKIFQMVLENQLTLVLSTSILKEVKDVLYREKFDCISKGDKDEFFMLLVQIADILEPKHIVDVCRDKKDNKFIELALSAKVKYVITGDNDLLALKKYKNISIVAPREFLNLFIA